MASETIQPDPKIDAAEDTAKDDAARENSALGDRARDRLDWRNAADHYRRALDVRPEWWEIRVQYGHALKELGYYSESENQYRQAIAENPQVADTYLQLGHVLKLQHRLPDAQEAYLAAMCFDPGLQSARNELKDLGVGSRVIEQHLAAKSLSRNPSGEQKVFGERLFEQPPVAPKGVIVEVGSRYVAGEIHNVSRTDLPIVIVCSAGEETLATKAFDLDEVSSSLKGDELWLSTPLRFRFDLPERLTSPVVHVRLEPASIEVTGSPFVRPGPDAASLLTRLERLETIVDLGGVFSELEAKLEEKLARSIAGAVTASVEALLHHQRTMFERQLVAAERILGMPPETELLFSSSTLVTTEAICFPVRKSFLAQDGFPGLGWFGAENPAPNIYQQWMGIAGRATFSIAPASGFVLRARISEVRSEHLLRGIRLAAGGALMPLWIERVAGNRTYWTLSAVLPGSVRQADGSVAITFTVGDALASRPGYARKSIALSELELVAIPTVGETRFRFDGAAPWFIKGWEPTGTLSSARQIEQSALVALPVVEAPSAATVTFTGRGFAANLAADLNGDSLPSQFRSADRQTFAISAQSWRKSANLLRLTLPPLADFAGVRAEVDLIECIPFS